MPRPAPVPPAQLGGPRRSLRDKGLILFAAVSAYVVAGTVLLAWTALAAPSATERPESVLGLASVVVILGLSIFGAFLTLALGRLAADVGRLQARALEVASGVRASPLAMDRDDEVGQLARSVEKMATDLAAREAEIAASRLEQFHNERMMLLGGIAAGMDHEIGNPVAAIVAMADELEAARLAGRESGVSVPELVSQARRLSAVTRRLSMVAGWRSKQAAPLGLNALLDGVVALVSLDRRFRGLHVELEADPELPAIVAAEDDVVQLLMHLLVNAAEALDGARTVAPHIRVATSRSGQDALLEVIDNGPGMDEETRALALEPLFTTKPAGRGNGLGLDACRRIMARSGGEILLRSRPGLGTRVTCRFPSISPRADVIDSGPRSET